MVCEREPLHFVPWGKDKLHILVFNNIKYLPAICQGTKHVPMYFGIQYSTVPEKKFKWFYFGYGKVRFESQCKVIFDYQCSL